jgi:hypothetical protein
MIPDWARYLAGAVERPDWDGGTWDMYNKQRQQAGLSPEQMAQAEKETATDAAPAGVPAAAPAGTVTAFSVQGVAGWWRPGEFKGQLQPLSVPLALN